MLLTEAGCTKKVWNITDGKNYAYHWIPSGLLLAEGVCIKEDYQKHFPPPDGRKKVYSMVAAPQVRDVDAKKKILYIDFTLTLRWLD